MNPKSLRILYVIDEMEDITAGGTERQILLMLDLLRQAGADVHLCVLRGTKWLEQLSLPYPVTYFEIRSVFSPSGVAELWRLFQFMRRGRFDLVQSFFIEANILIPVVGWAARVPVRIGSRRNLNHALGMRLRPLQSLSNLFVTRLMANCRAVQDAVARTESFAANKTDVVFNALDVARFRPVLANRRSVRDRLGIGDNILIVGNTSTLREPKGLHDFVRAGALAIKETPEIVLLLVGDGPQRADLEDLARSLGVYERVVFAGAQTEIAPWLHAMDIAVLSSSAEGFSNSILEYLAAGLPSVVTDVGGNAEALADCGIVVPSGNAARLSQAIVALSKDAGKRSDFARRALLRAATFDLDAARDRLYRYYLAIGRG